jgi:excinuclease ABC subunit A
MPEISEAPGAISSSSAAGEVIRVRGARVHNLRDLDVDVPRNKLVVLTGVSGSGKSSLAFDTLFGEGQRRYIEGLSSYARQFLDQLEPPDVDLIEGLPPTVAIEQRAGSASPRSTVATVAQAHDFLRVLYARAGEPHCPACGREISRMSPEQMVGAVLGLSEGRKVILMAPLVRGRKGQHAEAFEAIRRAGLIRARVDGEMIEVAEEPPKLAKTKNHTIEAVVDRLVVREGIRPRLAEGVDRALLLADGNLVLSIQQEDGAWADRTLSTRLACPGCGTGLEEIEPRTFSFNSPHGACRSCEGLGVLSDFDPELVIPDRSKSLAAGAFAPLPSLPPRLRDAIWGDPALEAFLKGAKVGRDTPLSAWPAKAIEQLLEGKSGGKAGFAGWMGSLRAAYEGATEKRKEELDAFRGTVPCPACGGARLRPEARAVTVGGKSLPALLALPAGEAAAWLGGVAFAPPLDEVGPPVVKEIVRRLEFLDRVGLSYLSLDRPADTLSGGELQRVRLAAQIGSGLVGVCYVLDEPTAGLHPRDTARLLDSLVALRDLGNSVLVVEHDEATIRAADWLIDLGPGAGPEGGRLVAEGPPESLVEAAPGASPTKRYLEGAHADEVALGNEPAADRWIVVKGATANNLKGVEARFPVGCLSCVTGVSGSGKSTLVLDILARAALRQGGAGGPRPGAHEAIEGLEAIERTILVDQAPIGRTPRSTPATYTGLFDEIRRVYATTREAKVRGFGASRFSFNRKEGRCPACEGQGERRVEMDFLPDLYVPCESCRGLRFNRPTLEARFKGRSIGEVVQMRVDEALPLFDAIPRVLRGLRALHEAGLGYVCLGQSSTTLSGGEAQRVKLAAELGRTSAVEPRTLYILDEPTTGLHFADVDNLKRLLRLLVDRGHTVIVIEHNLDLVRAADWVVDLGPEGGDAGGRVVGMGPPGGLEEFAESYTGKYLVGM